MQVLQAKIYHLLIPCLSYLGGNGVVMGKIRDKASCSLQSPKKTHEVFRGPRHSRNLIKSYCVDSDFIATTSTRFASPPNLK